MLFLAACRDEPPTGQVAARVDGIEITDRELLSEAAISGADVSQPAIRMAVLDRLIDRKLLARAGMAALTDRTPAAQLESRRAREDVLARAYARRIAAGLTPPGSVEIDRFMRDNPRRFAARTNYLFDRVIVTRANAGGIANLTADETARSLNRAAAPYRRQLVLIDSDTLAPTASERIEALSSGQTVRSITAGEVVVDTLILRQPVIEPAATQRARARAVLTQRQSTAAVNAAIAALRRDAEIAIRPVTPQPRTRP